MKDYSEYSVEDFNRAFMRFYEALTYGKQPVKSPTAFLLGGQGGSGKSSIHEYLSSEIGNIVSIDGDLFRREHPNYEMIQKIYGKDAANITQSFANNITNAMIEKLSDEGYNLVIEGTCRRADVPLKTCGDLKEKGYRVELAIMCADKEEAWQSTLDRAEKMRELGLTPREVPKEKYQETIIALPGNVSILYQSGAFDDITLFNRQLEELYKFSRTPDHDPADIFYHCLHSRSDEFYRPRSGNPMAVLLYANSLDEARSYLEHNFYELTDGKQLDEGFFQFSCSSAGRPLPDIEVYDVSAPENEDDEEEEPENEDDEEEEPECEM